MASPLTFFRRHQKGIMVAVICLCMFTFVVADAMNSSSNPEATLQNLPLMIGLLFGIIVGWIVGFKQQNVWAYIAVCGLIGGLAFNMIGSKVNLGAKVGQTGVNQQKLTTLIQDQQFSNNFFGQLQDVILGFPTGNTPSFFGFQQESVQNDAVVAEAFQREAAKLGMVIPDQFISEFIVNFTDKRITKQQFGDMLKRMGVTENQLYDVLREQFLARNAFRVLQPLDYPTPYAYWDAYRKLNQHAELDVIQLSVANFLDGVKDPDQATLQKFFVEHKEVLAGAKGEGSPGFKLPARAKLSYVEIGYESIEKTIPEITTQEIEEYYNKNKEKYPVNIFDTPVTPDEKVPPKTDESPKSEQMNKDDSKSGNNKPTESAPPEMKLPAEGKPAEPATPGAAAPGSTSSDSPGKIPVDTTPAAVPSTEAKPEEKPASEPQSKFIPKNLIPGLTDKKFWQVGLLQEEKPAAADKTAVAPTGDAADKTSENPVVLPQNMTDIKAPAMTTGSTIPEGFEKPAVSPPATEAPKIRPLDDELKKEIKDTLLRDKTLEKLESTSKEIEGKLYDLGTYTAYLPSDPAYKTPEQANKEFKDLCEQKKLYFNMTKLLSQKQFQEMEDEYAIVNTVTPLPLDQSQAFPSNNTAFAEIIFADDKPVLYSPIALENIETKNRYICWMTEYSPMHVPTYEEAGVKEMVLNAWKSIEARSLISKRGQEIIDALKKSDKSASETLSGQTETGQENSSQLVVGTTGSFTWMSTSTVPAANFRTTQQVELSSVPAISGGAGDEFMEVVFNKLSPGEYGIAPNADKTVYFVVKLITRDAVDTLYPKLLEENGWLTQNARSVGALFGEKQEKVRDKFQEQILSRNGLKVLSKEDEERIEQQESQGVAN